MSTTKRATLQNAAIIILAIAIIVMSVGYAAFNTNLNINGESTIQAANWDVHFETPVENTNGLKVGTVTKPATLNGITTVEFGVSLAPGDVYSFTVDAVNNGTSDAGLTSAILEVTKKVGDNASEDVTSSVVGTTYNDGLIEYTVSPVEVGSEILNKKVGDTLGRKQYTVTVKAIASNADGAIVEIEKTDYTFKLKLVYEQVQV